MIKDIYVIDDDKDALELIEFYLKDENYNVSLFNNVSKLLKEIKNKVPDLLITDICMPDKSGIDIINTIGLKDLNILLMSSYSYDEYMNKYKLKTYMSNIDLIRKPILKEELLEKIKTYE